jgi:Tfp pilus assembly protein PilO
MKLQMNSTNRAIAAIVILAVLGFAFWTMLLSPKRDEARTLGTEIEDLKASLSQHEAEVAEGEAAREEFPTEYQRLVVLGKAVPGDDDVASLLVQMNRISDAAGGTFREIQLAPGSGESETAATAPAAASEGTPVSATEVAASLLPLGATIGPAGLAVMPYTIAFDGNFFEIADFIKGLDSLVKTGEDEVTVDGRLVTIDGFSLEADSNAGFPALNASFALTTYLTPPSEGVAGGATETAPPTATPAATTIGATP